MRLTDRMIDNTKELNRQKKRQNDIQQDPEEDETGMAYMPFKKPVFLNEDRGAFTESKALGGINTEKSVFDRQAVFRVKNEER